jgi:PAS domain-containing protein
MASKYRELFDKSADACLVINNGIFVDCNQATVDMLRLTPKQKF